MIDADFFPGMPAAQSASTKLTPDSMIATRKFQASAPSNCCRTGHRRQLERLNAEIGGRKIIKKGFDDARIRPQEDDVNSRSCGSLPSLQRSNENIPS